VNPGLAAALEWAELGVPAIACDGKNPGGFVGRGWQRYATTDPDRLTLYWQNWPDANPGIVPGRVVLPIDVDRPDEFERFQSEHGAAPPTPRCYTNGEPGVLRERLIFRHPGVELDDFLCPGVQLRDGERVSIVPPSVNPNTGEHYEWKDAIDEVPILPLPEAWLKAARAPKRRPGTPARSADEWLELFTADVPQGERHDTLLKVAAFLIVKLGTASLTHEVMCAWNERRCKPPLPADELRKIVVWVAEREARGDG
jgi:hypothetical protein